MRPGERHPSALEQHRARAQPRDLIELMRHHDDRNLAAHQLRDLRERARLEAEVADREHFVDEQHVGLEVRRDGEPEARVHAARIALDRRVDEIADPRELDDLVELAGDLGLPHAHDRALQEDVLAAGEIGMEAGGDFNQRADAAADFDVAFGRPQDVREQLERRGLAGAVRARSGRARRPA